MTQPYEFKWIEETLTVIEDKRGVVDMGKYSNQARWIGESESFDNSWKKVHLKPCSSSFNHRDWENIGFAAGFLADNFRRPNSETESNKPFSNTSCLVDMQDDDNEETFDF